MMSEASNSSATWQEMEFGFRKSVLSKPILITTILLGLSVLGGIVFLRQGYGLLCWPVAAIAVYFLVKMLRQLMPGAAYLRITADGLRIRMHGNTDEIAFKDVERFGVMRMGKYGSAKRAYLGLTYTQASGLTSPNNDVMDGLDYTVPDCFECDPVQLAPALNKYLAGKRGLAGIETRDHILGRTETAKT